MAGEGRVSGARPFAVVHARRTRGLLIGVAAAAVFALFVAAVLLISGDRSDAGSAGALTDEPTAVEGNPAAPTSAVATPAGRAGLSTVGIVGDSITQGSATAIRTVLTAAGMTSIEIEAQRNRRIEAGSGRTADEPLNGVDQIEAMIRAGVSPDAWVIALGTNDVTERATAADYERLIDLMVAQVPAGVPLVWVDVYRPGAPEGTALFNEVLRGRIRSRPRSTVVSWAEQAAKPKPELLSADDLHPNAAGREVFAGLIVSGLAAVA